MELYINKVLYTFKTSDFIAQSAVVVERWPHTPMSVGSNPSAAVDCLP